MPRAALQVPFNVECAESISNSFTTRRFYCNARRFRAQHQLVVIFILPFNLVKSHRGYQFDHISIHGVNYYYLLHPNISQNINTKLVR